MQARRNRQRQLREAHMALPARRLAVYITRLPLESYISGLEVDREVVLCSARQPWPSNGLRSSQRSLSTLRLKPHEEPDQDITRALLTRLTRSCFRQPQSWVFHETRATSVRPLVLREHTTARRGPLDYIYLLI